MSSLLSQGRHRYAGTTQIQLPRISLQSRRLDAGDRADLVIVGRVAADADRAEQNSAILDQDAAGHRYQTAWRQRIHRADKIGLLLRPLEQRARALAYGECAIGLAMAISARSMLVPSWAAVALTQPGRLSRPSQRPQASVPSQKYRQLRRFCANTTVPGRGTVCTRICEYRFSMGRPPAST